MCYPIKRLLTRFDGEHQPFEEQLVVRQLSDLDRAEGGGGSPVGGESWEEVGHWLITE